MYKRMIYNLKPAKIFAIGFFSVILIGAILLMMPFSSKSGNFTSFIDALFTSTSAVCVTGLAVFTTSEYWSSIGKTIIIILIQFGGLGVMTVASMGAIAIGRRVSLKSRLAMKDSLNESGISGVVRLTKQIILLTFFIEALGAFFLSFTFVKEFGYVKGILYSIFHSISAFCNAGFDLIGSASLAPYRLNLNVNLSITFLIIFGGIGFGVIVDMFTFKKKKKFLHTKFVIAITLLLIISGFLLFFLIEFNNEKTLGNYGLVDKVKIAYFQSVTTRTAGFSTIDQANLKDTSLIITNILMFIGGSPGSTAGGIKTTTIGVLIIATFSIIRGSNDINLFKKRLTRDLVVKAVTVFFIALTVVFTSIILLTITDPHIPLGKIVFESVSAFATVGLSTGITSSLSELGRIIISITMFFGRVGPLTIILAVATNSESTNLIKYAEGRINIG